MIRIMDDYYLSKEVEERLKDNEKPIRVEIDELSFDFHPKALKSGKILINL